MRISTTSGAWMDRGNGRYVPIIDCIPKLAAAGFDAVDLNLCHAIDTAVFKNGIEINAPDWEDWAIRLKNTLDKNNMIANQAHAPFYNVLDSTVLDRPFYEEMIRRSIIVSGRVGAPWVVIHAGTVPGSDTIKASLAKNAEYYKPHLELAFKHGTGIAIENLIDKLQNRNHWGYRQFTGGLDEMLELVQLLQRDFPNIGICWDFGHANMMAINQIEALRKMGNLLKIVHIHDNKRVNDDHTIPFAGSINWPPLMRTLKEIGYKGDFTYEHLNFTQFMPEELIDEALRLSVSVARHLISLMNEPLLH